MDAHAAQLHRQMDATRAAMDATLTQHSASRRGPPGCSSARCWGPVRGGQEIAAWAPTLIHVARLGCRGTWELWTGLAGAL